MASAPSLLDQLKSTGQSIGDALKSQYAAGPAGASLTPGAGSVLDQRNAQMAPLLPPTSPLVAPKSAPSGGPAPSDLVNPKAAYGSKPGEKRIDVKDYLMQLGLSGLQNLQRSPAPGLTPAAQQ